MTLTFKEKYQAIDQGYRKSHRPGVVLNMIKITTPLGPMLACA